MVLQETATKRYASTKRRIRWDRVVTCAGLLAIVAALGAYSINTANTDGGFDDNKGHIPIVTTSSRSEESDETVFTSTLAETVTQEVVTTITTAKLIVVQNKRPVILGISSSMDIGGIYFSKKLERIISVEEQAVLMMLILSEGAWEPYDTQVGIASTVLNRVLYDENMFPNTIQGVVTQKAQFSPVHVEFDGEIKTIGFYNNSGQDLVEWENYPETVQDSVCKAVYAALDGQDPTESLGGAIFYCNMTVLSRAEQEYRNSIGEKMTIGKTTFYRDWWN